MLTCQHCPTKFVNAKDYVGHLKTEHFQVRFGDFICPFCNVSFHILKTFCGHILKTCSFLSSPMNIVPELLNAPVNTTSRISGNVNDITPFPENIQALLNDYDEDFIESNQELIVDNHEEIQDINSIVDEQQFIERVALQVVLKLHSKPNFTRSDVSFILMLII